jgi:hypothetical protein
MVRFADGVCRWLLLVPLLAQGCGLDSGVGQPGSYVFVSDAPVVDSAPYPLQHLLIVEQDDEIEECLVYLFSGQIGRAGLGVADLRRIARGHGRAQMAFDLPRSRFAQAELSGEAVGPSVQIGNAAPSSLLALDDMALQQSGAARWLSSVKSDDYSVAAYFAALPCQGDAVPITIALDGGDLELGPMPAAAVEVRVSDEMLALDYDTPRADYVVIELWQAIAKTEMPDEAIEALVRTSLPPAVAYTVGASLVDSAAGQGCWSQARPVGARVTQIARAYIPRQAGDVAVILQRIDGSEIQPATWTALTDSPAPAGYCQDYQ